MDSAAEYVQYVAVKETLKSERAALTFKGTVSEDEESPTMYF